MTLPERWFRTNPDSSTLDRPRLLARSLIAVADLDKHVAFYERLLGVPADLRMPIPDFGGLELAAVGGLLLIASERPFTPIQRRTAYSLIVPSLDDQLERLDAKDTTLLEPHEVIMPGARARVRYPDGAVAELVEHRPQPGERPAPREAGSPTGVRLLARCEVPATDLDHAVTVYEKALDTHLVARAKVRARGVAELAVVGDLLLVGRDGADTRDRIAFGLLAPPSADVGSRLDAGEDRSLASLQTGDLAEVWDERLLSTRS